MTILRPIFPRLYFARTLLQWRPREIPPSWTFSRTIAGAATAEPQQVLPEPVPITIPPAPQSSELDSEKRWEKIKSAKPFSEFLTDTFARQHTYLRISITERCNLRCLYCMPAEGIDLSPPSHLLSTPEILELARIFVAQGVTKIRLTGGEPTVRKDIVELVQELGKLRELGLKEIAITSNGIALTRKLERMVDAGLTGLNLSLDTLDPWKFQFMTRRKGLENVLKTIDTALSLGFGTHPERILKLNCVVMKNVNDGEISDFVEMTRERPIEVRFIEYMPFDGNKWNESKMLPFASMLSQIRETHPTLTRSTQRPNDTSKTYQIPGYMGKIGFITSMTHNFCGTCNRLRITSDGNLKVCLFGNKEVSLRDMLREYREREEMVGAGEKRAEMEERLLGVIGAAVKGKKAGHAGMDELQKGGNRPMILIDNISFSRRRSAFLPYPIPSPISHHPRLCSSKSSPSQKPTPTLSHTLPSGAAHMVPISSKPISHRTATAKGTVSFSNPHPLRLIAENANKKGDVISISRIAGIMATKKTPEIVPLCHNIAISSVIVDLCVVTPVGSDSDTSGAGQKAGVEENGERERREGGGIEITVTVTCDGKTGVEMEALTGVMGAALTVVDMCKAVDKRMFIEGVRVVEKRGGRSGVFVE
ncbi:hypothetical protein RUND412_003419 [Rhizina undulata]